MSNPEIRTSFKSPSALLNPTSVAIVGASERSGWPKKIWESLLASGFAGPVFAVNPRLTSVWGEPCYPDLASLPAPADHAIVIVPAPIVNGVLETGIAAGLKSATVYAGSFGEGGNPEGEARAAALSQLVQQSGIALSGPNCMGGNNLHSRFFGYPNKELVGIRPGSVALVSQSGGTLQFIAKTSALRGVGFSHMISSGNEIDLDLADFINFFVDDEKTKIVALFIEGIRRPEMFMKAAARALAAGKPIIAIKTGKSQHAQASALSHTGAISGDYDVYKAMCERYGIVRCDTLDDMVEMLLAFQGGRLPKGSRVGWVTTSGGTVDLLYDYVEEIGGITSPAFDEDTKKLLKPFVPADMEVKNPLDAGIPSNDDNALALCLAIARDPNVDMLAWARLLPTGTRPADPSMLKRLMAETEKPVLAFSRMRYVLEPGALAFQEEAGFPFLQALPETVRTLGALAFYGARARSSVPDLPAAKGQAGNLEGDTLDKSLRDCGIALPKSAFAKTSKEAASLAAEIGFPVALKLVSPQFSHKTEVGGVKLGLTSRESVEQEANALGARIKRISPDAEIDGFLIQEMVSGVEVIVGARTDPLYGPILVVGAGGILVELTKDVATRLLPVGPDDARTMLTELKVSKLLAGYRGGPPADVDALVRAICALSSFYLDHRHLISDLEINPLIVLPNGNGVRAIDVRLVRA